MTAYPVHAPNLGPTGLDAELPTEVADVQREARRFAENVMRPLAAELDTMSAADVVAPGSPIHQFFDEVQRAGLADMSTLGTLEPSLQALMMPVLMEELGWGDAGLAMLSLARDFAKFAAYSTNNAEVIERFSDGFGCFLCTQPDRGSDSIDHLNLDTYPGARPPVGNLTVKRSGADFIVRGQSSDWISGSPIASCGIAYAACDFGDGFYGDENRLNYIGLIVPFDEPGVSKGRPLEKLGQRSLPQGAVFFDDVRVPEAYVVAAGDDAHRELAAALTIAKSIVATAFVGVGRAAFDHAFTYVHEREQGGVPLIRHQAVRHRVFAMWRKLESSRSLVRRALQYHYGPYGPSPVGGITAKVHSTEIAYELAQEAMRLFGGNGLTLEYPIEKLLRDCQASLIEDGENNVLGLNAVSMLSQTFTQRSNNRLAASSV